MDYKYEQDLQERAEEFISRLRERGLEGKVTMIRDYMIKVNIIRQQKQLGEAVIYYKPSADKYTLKTDNLKDKSFISRLEKVWMLLEGDEYKGYKFYVDGSYQQGKVGYGCVVVKDNEVIAELSGEVNIKPYTEHHQIGGEIKAVETAVNWAQERGLNEIKIYYDLANLEKWATGEFKTNNELTVNYKNFMQKCGIRIIWQKVVSHSGDKWNERADGLAREGIISNN